MLIAAVENTTVDWLENKVLH